MKIFDDIMKQATAACRPQQTNLHVVDTVSSFWQQINNNNLQAKVFDASSLLDTFSGASFRKCFDREMEFRHLSPFTRALWIEAADPELSANLAVSLDYASSSGQAAEQAKQYGITDSFSWTCRARAYLKRPYQPTLPLKWEWVEYISATGGAVSSLLQPLALPQYLERQLAPRLKGMEFMHHHLCAFIANLGLYTVELINSSQASIKTQSKKMFSYQVVGKNENVSGSETQLDAMPD